MENQEPKPSSALVSWPGGQLCISQIALLYSMNGAVGDIVAFFRFRDLKVGAEALLGQSRSPFNPSEKTDVAMACNHWRRIAGHSLRIRETSFLVPVGGLNAFSKS